jgi:cytidine deaminase
MQKEENQQRENLKQGNPPQKDMQQENLQQESLQKENSQQENRQQENLQQENPQKENSQQENLQHQQEDPQQENPQQENPQQENTQQENLQQENLQQENPQRENIQMNSLVPQDKGELISRTEIVTRSVVKNLIREAIEGMKFSYAPYSNFRVGAALLTAKEKIYTGCNIENAAFGSTNCAERTALFKAVSEGEREFAAIAIVGGKNGIISDFCPPCGVCRQVIREFVDPKTFLVILARSEEDYIIYSLEALLPLSFGPESL